MAISPSWFRGEAQAYHVAHMTGLHEESLLHNSTSPDCSPSSFVEIGLLKDPPDRSKLRIAVCLPKD
jgi:hypothetical protein